jgi:hypothetical protein
MTIDNITPVVLTNIKDYLSFNFPFESLNVYINTATNLITLDFTYN